jgi:hypothetical protein
MWNVLEGLIKTKNISNGIADVPVKIPNRRFTVTRQKHYCLS